MIKESDLLTRESFDDAIINSSYYTSVKEFGATGDGITDDSDAIQKTINNCINKNGKNGGTIIFPNGVYLIKKPITVNCLGVRLIGESTQGTVLKISSDFVGTRMIHIYNDLYTNLGKIVIENIKFDATDNNNEIHGIEFMPIIYNNVFRNLDFESFTGSWFKNTGTMISEGIKWTDITGNPRNKIYTSSPFHLERINESIMINCKIFGKQYHNYPYPTLPLVYVEVPQQFNFLSNNFSNVNGEAIKIVGINKKQIQGVKIDGCHFEDIDSEKEYTPCISIIGDSINKSEYGFIGVNRYLEITKPSIEIDNAICMEINDNKPNIILGSGTNACYVITTVDNGSKIVDNGVNNIITAYGSNGIKFYGNGDGNIFVNGKYAYTRYSIHDGENWTIQNDRENDKLNSLNFKYNGTIMGGFNNYGMNIKYYDSMPSNTYFIPNGTMFVVKDELCIKANGVTRKIKLQ